jgi:hypothetical protein
MAVGLTHCPFITRDSPSCILLRVYEPPTGTKLVAVNVNTAASEFEWNELAKRSGAELWCIRLPLAVSVTLKPMRRAKI